MSINSDLETANKAGFESGYEKGVRDMWVKSIEICKYYEDGDCAHEENKGNCALCVCPIAQKLLKAVK